MRRFAAEKRQYRTLTEARPLSTYHRFPNRLEMALHCLPGAGAVALPNGSDNLNVLFEMQVAGVWRQRPLLQFAPFARIAHDGYDFCDGDEQRIAARQGNRSMQFVIALLKFVNADDDARPVYGVLHLVDFIGARAQSRQGGKFRLDRKPQFHQVDGTGALGDAEQKLLFLVFRNARFDHGPRVRASFVRSGYECASSYVPGQSVFGFENGHDAPDRVSAGLKLFGQRALVREFVSRP
jgi:hypothetical protein